MTVGVGGFGCGGGFISSRWFWLSVSVYNFFSPLMGCGSPFGGFCVTICGFCWFLHLGFFFFFFFAEIAVASGYGWIWLWVHNREKREIEVLGFREI